MEDGRVASIWMISSSGIVSHSALWFTFVIGLQEEGPGKNKLGFDISHGAIGSVASVTIGPNLFRTSVISDSLTHCQTTGLHLECRKVRSQYNESSRKTNQCLRGEKTYEVERV